MGCERTLLSLALNDEPSLQSALLVGAKEDDPLPLDPRTQALVRLAAFVALGATPASYGWAVDAAFAAGATVDEIVSTLLTVVPVVGMARAVTAAPGLATALGYDIEAALERR
jgi:alkylhydroperoxidase/carboxymuconolactone decarboxylase family protein YurZ